MYVPSEKGPANSVPAAAVIRKVQALSGFIGFKGSAGRTLKSVVKYGGSTSGLQLILGVLSTHTVDAGIHGVAVKCSDIMKNSDREGRYPGCN